MAFVYIIEEGERNYGSGIKGVFEGNPAGLKLARSRALVIMADRGHGEPWTNISRAHFASLVNEWVADCDYVRIRKLHIEQASQSLRVERTLPSCIPTFSPRFSNTDGVSP